MTISIIILSYNTKDLLISCLDSIYKYIPKDLFEIIVVDNASKDGSVEMLKKKFSKVKVIENKENFGFTKGNNIGTKKALGKYLFFLNSDAKLKNNKLLDVINLLDSNNQIGVVGGQLIKGQNFEKSFGPFYDLPHVFLWLLGSERVYISRLDKPKEVDWVTGACMVIRKELFDKLEGFDENIFMYTEDMELCYRVKKNGYKIYHDPQLEIEHVGQGSSNKSFAVLNIYKGILYFYKKHKNRSEYIMVRLLLYVKAGISLIFGVLFSDNYLKDTYWKAFKI